MPFARRSLALAAASFLALAAGAATAQTANNPDFRVNNRSTMVINEIQVSSAQVASWGPDLLGRNVLPPGQSFEVHLPAGQCMNDVRVVFANGQAMERRAVNTCEITDFNVTP